MKNRSHSMIRNSGGVAALALSITLVAGCASTPQSPAGAAAARSNLEALQNDPTLSDRAGVERREAEQAVELAEQPLPDEQARLATHRVYMANQKVEIARAKATAAYVEAQRPRLAEERDSARLQSRTDEADRARSNEAELQRRIDAMEAKATDRGIVLTLGDVLFASGSAELQRGGYDNLNRLVDFLEQYPDRGVMIEGHTDSVGSAAYNTGLSQRRADSVRAYLARKGIGEERIVARGQGESRPIATNETPAGREQNRRVEIIIENAPQVSGSGS